MTVNQERKWATIVIRKTRKGVMISEERWGICSDRDYAIRLPDGIDMAAYVAAERAREKHRQASRQLRQRIRRELRSKGIQLIQMGAAYA